MLSMVTPLSDSMICLYDGLHFSVKINYKECKEKLNPLLVGPENSIHVIFTLALLFFNLYSSWNINGWNSEKRDGIINRCIIIS
ncbi:hypothetical protein H8356DRAFT_1354375 [Neocallimastix lanati (nom. inval.)]|nr:hypothetical protein H8356DRAFT_1354375 [Neocallimastix sp. JGI-2020a]